MNIDANARGKLKTTFMCPKIYRDKFATSTAQMTISVGQSVHEGERLLNICDLINRSFAECKIMIDDSIQWYTLAIGEREKSPDELLQMAILAGDDYLARNRKCFDNVFTIPCTILRWKDWINTPIWQKAIENMHAAYQSNQFFKQAIDENVNSFLTRYEKNSAKADYDRHHAVKMCTYYLLEECAVMKDLWTEIGCHYEVYPSGRNQAMSATHSLFIEPHFPELLLSVGIRFNRMKTGVTDGQVRQSTSTR